MACGIVAAQSSPTRQSAETLGLKEAEKIPEQLVGRTFQSTTELLINRRDSLSISPRALSAPRERKLSTEGNLGDDFSDDLGDSARRRGSLYSRLSAHAVTVSSQLRDLLSELEQQWQQQSLLAGSMLASSSIVQAVSPSYRYHQPATLSYRHAIRRSWVGEVAVLVLAPAVL
jgi:hypothetical protein